MRIAFVSVDDVEDVKTFSGVSYHVLQEFRRSGVEVESISPLNRWFKYLYSPQKLMAKFLGYGFHIDRHPLALWIMKKQIERRLRGKEVDAVFAMSSTPIAKVDTTLPMFYWIDGVVEGMVGYYGGPFGKMTARELRIAHDEQASAMQRATKVVLASEWAAREARRSYAAADGKIEVIEFGANMEITHGAAEVMALIVARMKAECVLLFIGVDWERKGGAFAFEAARILNERGIKTTLKVVGCDAPEAPFVERLGFISKHTAEGLERLRELYRSSTFFVMPTRAEATGIVFCESAAYGLPVVTTRTGGVAEYVMDGETGYCLPLEATGEAYADAIERAWMSPQIYKALSLGAFKRYEELLNWKCGVGRLVEMMQSAVQS